MEAVMKIIEENIPEVILLFLMFAEIKWQIIHYNLVLKNQISNAVIGHTECFYMCLFFLCQLSCLNLSNNRMHKLDDLADLVTKAPHLKTLNLSNNEVKLASPINLDDSKEMWIDFDVLSSIFTVKLKSDRELDKLKGLKLVELWLNRNPLCDLFKDQASYIRSVKDSEGWEEEVLRAHNGVTVGVEMGVSGILSFEDFTAYFKR